MNPAWARYRVAVLTMRSSRQQRARHITAEVPGAVSCWPGFDLFAQLGGAVCAGLSLMTLPGIHKLTFTELAQRTVAVGRRLA